MSVVEGHPLEEVLFIIALALVAVVTIFANLLVIGAFCVDKRLRKTNNFFIISLTIAGLLIGGYSIPLYCITRWTKAEPLTLCDLCGFLDNALATISLWTLAMTSLDRYYMVLSYKRYTQLVTGNRAKIVLVTVWLYGFAVCAPPLLGWNAYHFNNGTSTCGIKNFRKDDGPGREFFLFYFFLSFPLPLVIVIYSYFWIFMQAWGVYKRRAKRQAENDLALKIDPLNRDKIDPEGLNYKNGTESSNGCVGTRTRVCDVLRNGSFLARLSPNSVTSLSTSSNDRKKFKYRKLNRTSSTVGGMSTDKTVRATLMVFVLVVTYIVCTFPIFVFSIILYFDETIGAKIPSLTHTLTLFLFWLNSALNPIMYGVFNTNFRGTFSRLLCCRMPEVIRTSTVKYVKKFSRSNSSFVKHTHINEERESPTHCCGGDTVYNGSNATNAVYNCSNALPATPAPNSTAVIPGTNNTLVTATNPLIRIHIITGNESSSSSSP